MSVNGAEGEMNILHTREYKHAVDYYYYFM